MDRRPLRRAERTVLLALSVTCVLAAAKLGVWLTTSSLVVLSQAVDSAIDIVTLALLWVGLRIAAKPADDSHHYGHAKAENLVAFAQTLVLGGIVVGIAVEAMIRLFGAPSDAEAPGYAIALLLVSGVVDVARVRILLSTARVEGSEALRAGALNFATDVATALVAVVSLLAVRAGIERADALGGLLVAAAVAFAAVRLGRTSVDVLMDRAPAEPVQAIEAAAAAAPGVSETRRVRVRSGGDRLFADVTVAAGRTSSLERAHDIAEAVEREIARVAPGADVVVHVEPRSETDGLVERVQAAASRADGIHEVHNVAVWAVTEENNEKLRVTLHAKASAGVALEEAHRLSDRIEAEVRAELGSEVRVDTHLEPLETTAFGNDVTASRADVVADVIRVATAEPDVLDAHEVLITSAGEELSILAHVRGRRDLPLARIHQASERIEKALHAKNPEIGAVLIHFEPD